MSVAPQFLYGDSKPVTVTIATAQAVTRGDLCAMISNTLVRAADITWDTDLATTQTDFAAAFVGVSAYTKAANVAAPLGPFVANVNVCEAGGTFEYDLAVASTVEVGEFYGPAKDTGNALLSQALVKVATAARAIGVCVERGTTVSRVKIKLLAKLIP